MPNFPNVHANLENGELHVPKDFSIADNDTLLGKNLNAELEWFPTYWQRPVIDLVDASLVPPTAVDGDRYILRQMSSTAIGSTAIDSTVIQSTAVDTTVVIDTTVLVDTTVIVDSTVFIDTTAIATTALDTTAINFPFVASTAIASTGVFNLGINSLWGDVNFNDIVEFYSLDDEGNTINAWRSVTPQQGYRVHNKGNDEVYFFDGTTWQNSGQTIDIAEAVSLTYAEAASLKSAGQLEMGKSYWLTDRSILLKAVAVNAFALEGDHTREIKALGYIELTGGASGEVADITVDGISIMSGAEPFDTDLTTTAKNVVTNINANTSTPNYSARQAGTRIIIFPEDDLGSTVNGYSVAASTSVITTTHSDLSNGQDVGANWFTVQFNFDNDAIYSMADVNNNEVSFIPGALAFLIDNPIDVFPWGNPFVFSNVVKNSVLTAYTAESFVFLNEVSDFSTLNTDAFKANPALFEACASNVLRNRSSLTVVQVSNIISDNDLINQSTVDASGATGEIDECKIDGGTVSALNFAGQFGSNYVTNDAVVTIDDATGNINQNEIAHVNTVVDLTNSSCGFFANIIKQSCTVSAVGAAGNITENNFLVISDITLDNFHGTLISNNHIEGTSIFTAVGSTGDVEIIANFILNATLNLDGFTGNKFQSNHLNNASIFNAAGASGEFFFNTISNSTITLNNYAGTQFQDNDISGNSTVDLTNYNGFGFSQNIVSNISTVTAMDTTGNVSINGNEVSDSTLTANNLLGGEVYNNQLFDDSTLNASGAQSSIFGNQLSSGTLLANNSSGEISRNEVGQTSTLNASSYSGGGCNFNIVNSGSSLFANNLSVDIVGNEVINASVFDLTDETFGCANNLISVANETIKFDNLIANTSISFDRSNYRIDIAIDSSGIIDFDQDFVRFAGILNITNSATLSQFKGFSKAPEEIILRVDNPGVNLFIDPAMAININAPSYSGFLVLQMGDFICLRKGLGGSSYNVVDIAINNLNATVIREAKFSLNSGQILLLNGTPTEILASPGSGRAIEVIAAVVLLDYNTTAYTGNTTLVLRNPSGNAQAESTILAQSSARMAKMDLKGSTPDSMIVADEGLEAYVETGNPASGDSPITIYVTYRLIEL